MSEVFQVCQANFYKSLRDAQKILKSPDVSQLKLSEASEALTQASQQLNKMQIQCSSNQDPQIRNKIDIFKDELRSYKKQLNKKQNFLRQEAQQNSGPLLQNDNEKGIDPLIQAKRQMYENQAVSNQVALNIRKNNEVLLKNVNRMGDINNQLTVAHKLLNSIKTKMRKNKLVMWGTFGFLLLVLLIILYTYFRDQIPINQPQTPTPTPAPSDSVPTTPDTPTSP